MNDPRNNQDRIDRAIEGQLSPEEWRDLQREIVQDPELRAYYVDQQWLHASLHAQRHSLPELLDAQPAPPPESRFRRFGYRWLAAAAALTVLLHAGFLYFNGRADHSMAVLIEADHCKWAGSDLPTTVNSKLHAGRLSLAEGIATLKFKRGTVLTLEAPTTLEIISDMQCRLIEGSIVADVPASAHGFTVRSPDMTVTDLGTRFGLTAGSTGNSHVFVFEGSVRIESPRLAEPRVLATGENFRIASGQIDSTQEPFRTRLKIDPAGWQSITTGFGRGADTYSRRGDIDGVKGRHPLLMVKHSDLAGGLLNERRAVLTFDLAQFLPASINQVELILDPEPSGLGFSTLVPDSRFAVYGVIDESFDAWNENAVLWATTPGCNDYGPAPGSTLKLLEFALPRGSSGEPLTLRSETLTSFVKWDTNGLVTFIVVRETGETDPFGLVHAFASKEHPTALPPTLRLR